MNLLGIDTGGTFTDFVLFDGRRLRTHKVLSTPQAPERAILQGIRELDLDLETVRLVHGSTVGTNAVLEGTGARTALITNRGLADLLTIGRQARRALYDLQPGVVAPPVPPELCLETGGRMAPDGTVVEPLTDEDLDALRAALQRLAPQAVAINLLFSFVDDRFERTIEEAVPDGLFVSRSSDILPEYREYERAVATWLNARVGPLMQGYLQRLQLAVAPAPLAVMQSSGGTIDAPQAGRQAVHLLLSGPAGGLTGALHVGRAAGCRRLLTFDMGGTSTDVALVDGAVRLSGEGVVAGYPVAVPMVDMHTIGAGGGSIAYVDDGGLLQVGPRSAGAEPGPACYGRGGRQPTVTDANLVLGRLRADAFLGGTMQLDVGAARAAVTALATQLGMRAAEAAEGIVRLANEHMAQALRVISIQRGVDPRDFALLSFGGAGGLHVCALAEALDMSRAVVPVHGGVLSALGMLSAPPSRQLSRTVGGPLEQLPPDELEAGFADLEDRGRRALAGEGVAGRAIQVERSVDLRYRGQSYTLNVPWSGPQGSARAFHVAHRDRYGHALDEPVELVNLRLAVRAPAAELDLGRVRSGPAAAPCRQVSVHGVAEPVPVYERAELCAGQGLVGPALVMERVATTWVAAGWQAVVHDCGALLLRCR